MLVVDGIEASYGAVYAIRGVSLRVGAGEIVAVLGGNGAGKSTILRAVSGLLKRDVYLNLREDQPARGTIRFEGRRIDRLPADQVVRLGIAHVPEGRGIFPELTVAENLRTGTFARPRRGGAAGDQEQVFETFPILRQRRRQMAGLLSGGEQQMLAIGRALMARPRLLLLDEPSLGLAPFMVQEIFRVIQRINAAGTAVLLVEQNARLALALTHRAYVLETGRIVLEGTGAELMANADVQEAYLGTRAYSAARSYSQRRSLTWT